jgi:Probable cobalt transporter subunit (CbtB)
MHPATPLPLRRLARPALLALLAAWLLLTLVAFDQGALAGLVTSAAGDSGGLLHELFHDARHLLGVPCH